MRRRRGRTGVGYGIAAAFRGGFLAGVGWASNLARYFGEEDAEELALWW